MLGTGQERKLMDQYFDIKGNLLPDLPNWQYPSEKSPNAEHLRRPFEPWILAYTRGELTEQAMTAFEIRMLSDERLAEAVEVDLLLREGVKNDPDTTKQPPASKVNGGEIADRINNPTKDRRPQ
jgi:hypothetical protein